MVRSTVYTPAIDTSCSCSHNNKNRHAHYKKHKKSNYSWMNVRNYSKINQIDYLLLHEEFNYSNTRGHHVVQKCYIASISQNRTQISHYER